MIYGNEKSLNYCYFSMIVADGCDFSCVSWFNEVWFPFRWLFRVLNMMTKFLTLFFIFFFIRLWISSCCLWLLSIWGLCYIFGVWLEMIGISLRLDLLSLWLVWILWFWATNCNLGLVWTLKSWLHEGRFSWRQRNMCVFSSREREGFSTDSSITFVSLFESGWWGAFRWTQMVLGPRSRRSGTTTRGMSTRGLEAVVWVRGMAFRRKMSPESTRLRTWMIAMRWLFGLTLLYRDSCNNHLCRHHLRRRHRHRYLLHRHCISSARTLQGR